MVEPLDFEQEDRLLVCPTASKRRKVISLDDLVSDFYMEKRKSVESKSKLTLPMQNDSDDEEKSDNKETMLSKFVDNCQKQVHELNAEDEIPSWGQKVFGYQKAPPSLKVTEIGDCKLLQSLITDEFSLIKDVNDGKESFLEGLLKNGWLSNLAFACGYVEGSVASWSFYKMLYSENEELSASACDFWCKVLLSQNEDSEGKVKLGWIPNFSELKKALEIYGYHSDTSNKCPSNSISDLECEGPPINLLWWIKLLSTCCQIRNKLPILSISEAEELVNILLNLSLERQLQGLSLGLYGCMLSVISFFHDSEWHASCRKIADSIPIRISRDLNSLRIIDCIPAVKLRGKQLKGQVAFKALVTFLGEGVTDAKKILKYLTLLDFKDKDCDFFKLYMYISFIENWLLVYQPLEEQQVLFELWFKFLRNCSSQIASTDWRSFASKVRNKASFLLQDSRRKEC